MSARIEQPGTDGAKDDSDDEPRSALRVSSVAAARDAAQRQCQENRGQRSKDVLGGQKSNHPRQESDAYRFNHKNALTAAKIPLTSSQARHWKPSCQPSRTRRTVASARKTTARRATMSCACIPVSSEPTAPAFGRARRHARPMKNAPAMLANCGPCSPNQRDIRRSDAIWSTTRLSASKDSPHPYRSTNSS